MTRANWVTTAGAALLVFLASCGHGQAARQLNTSGIDPVEMCALSMEVAEEAYAAFSKSGEAMRPFADLQLKAQFGSPKGLAVYLQRNGPPDQDRLDAALRYATYADNTTNMRAVLRMGADPNAQEAGQSALSVATACDRRGAAELLLASGADPYQRLQGGNDALMYAIAGGASEVADAILDTGFDACRNRNDRGQTAYEILEGASHAPRDPRIHPCSR